MKTGILKRLAIVLAMTYFAVPEIRSQIITAEQDPASTKWYKMDTGNYRIIFPRGNDSTAARYAKLLESARLPVSASLGFFPERQDVVLHPSNASAEVFASLLPSRMDFPILPQGRWTLAYPVEETSVIFASRKAAQLKFGRSYVFRPVSWFFGELVPLATTKLYPDPWMLDGDAFIAATALSYDVPGRYGDFINYYMAAFDSGDVRGYKWDRWMIGSFRHYTPDDSAFGYMILSGLRCLYDNPYYMKDFLEYSAKRPYDLLIGNTVNKKFTGGKFRTDVFRKILDYHSSVFSNQVKSRAPFSPSRPVCRDSSGKYEEYTRTATAGKQVLFSVRTGMDSSPELVMTDSSGISSRICDFDPGCSRLVHSERLGRIFWSELVPDIRWKQKKTNAILYMDLDRKKKKYLYKEGNVFNPSVTDDGKNIIAISGYAADRTAVIAIDGVSGELLGTVTESPEGTLFTECVMIGDRTYISGISSSGTSIYEYDDSLSLYAGPFSSSVRNLFELDGDLAFSSDFNGVFDLYAVRGEDKKICRITSDKYGAVDFAYDAEEGYLYYSRLTASGYSLRKLHRTSFSNQETDAASPYIPEISSRLAAQEDSISSGRIATGCEAPAATRYRKGLHLFKIHSWAPVYFDIDRIRKKGGDELYDYASVGATVLSQNTLGTAYGSAGYSFRPASDGSGFVHGGHADFTYAGWFPVIEGSVHINDKTPYDFMSGKDGKIFRIKRNHPYISGRISLYVPLSLENGGNSRGMMPSLTWELDNSRFDGRLNHKLSFHGKIWIVRDKAVSEIFPRSGAGLESGAVWSFSAGPARPALKLSNSWYMYAYAYFPGITEGQGGKVSLTANFLLSRGSYNPASEILPRGLVGSDLRHLYNPGKAFKFTFDYVVPIHLGDINITPLFYLRRLILTPHFDYTVATDPIDRLYSAGGSATLDFGRFVWAFPIEIGVEYSYNGGTLVSVLQSFGNRSPRHSFKPVVRISF